MPSSTPKQAAFMRAAAHNPQFAAKAGIPVAVAKEFVAADNMGNNKPSHQAKHLAGLLVQRKQGG